jgi:hypothetical protein
MADAFDDFIKDALSPPERSEDHLFVVRVQAAIRLEEQLGLQRRSIARQFAIQLVGLVAVAAGAFVVSKAPAVASLAGESPWLAGLALLALFGLLVALLTADDRAGAQVLGYSSGLTS